MHGDLLDLVLVLAAVVFFVSGYRQGFLVGVLSFVGLLGGGLLGATIAPEVATLPGLSGAPRALVGLVVVLGLAALGQVLASVLGGSLRGRLTWRPARTFDSVAGALISVVSLLLVAWLVGRAVADSPFPTAASQVRRSLVINAVDRVVPDAGRQLSASFRDLIDSRGFPQVFENALRVAPERDVVPPDPAVAGSELVARVRPSILKITGSAPSCRKNREGTGFVYAPGRVMTNAHVLAGVSEPRVEVGGQRLAATVVLYDPGRDVAVLRVPGLDRPALGFAAEPAEADDDAVVAGYPLDGPFRADAARIITRQQANAPDIYGNSRVQREIYSIKGLVRQGNSGGPLLNPEGRVEGVIFASAADDTSIGYALTAAYVASSAERARLATEPVSTQECD